MTGSSSPRPNAIFPTHSTSIEKFEESSNMEKNEGDIASEGEELDAPNESLMNFSDED